MKVLFVTRGWPTKKDPMSGNYEAVQAKALVKKGVDVTVLIFRWQSILHLFDKKVSVFFESGVKVFIVNIIQPSIPHVLSSFKLNVVWKRNAFRHFYKKYLKNINPVDIIHAHSAFEAFFIPPVVKAYHIPFVITEHWSKMNNETVDSESMEMAKVSYAVADKVITVSKALADSLENKFGIKSTIIHNMVPDSFFEGDVRERKNSLFRIFSVGELREGKRFDILIKALAKSSHKQDCILTIIGDGSEMENLKQCILENNMQNHVFMAGRKTQDEVNLALMDADCFALTSNRETFGIVYIEAMAKGGARNCNCMWWSRELCLRDKWITHPR